eukprot:1152131-Pelagomonas_calceolata.AAC.8
MHLQSPLIHNPDIGQHERNHNGGCIPRLTRVATTLEATISRHMGLMRSFIDSHNKKTLIDSHNKQAHGEKQQYRNAEIPQAPSSPVQIVINPVM